MKKLYCILGLIIFLCTSFTVAAKVVEYQPNVFTDETAIEEDFQNLNMDINDYYQPKYNYGKWYVVAMSEGYVDTESFDIQTYFYIYNPSSPKNYEYWYQDNDDVGEEHYNEIDSFLLDYKISGNQKSVISDVLSINYDHHIYKVKGFIYSYTEKAEIEVLKIQNYMTSGPGFVSESTFKSTCHHSKLNGFSVELKFDSTLVIEEYEIVSITIPKKSDFWTLITLGYKESVRANFVFYNFNFPKSIEPDEILKAVFNYDLVSYRGIVNRDEEGGAWATTGGHEYEREEIRPKVNDQGEYEDEDLGVYVPGTHTYKASTFSKELSFETFVLGNRVKKGEFDYVDMATYEDKFEYDCSILLGNTTIECVHPAINGSEKSFQKFENVEFIELQYKKEGIVYTCQIVSKPIDEPPSLHPTIKKTWWEKFLDFLVKMFDFIFYDMLHMSFKIPKIGKQIISGIILFVLVFFVIPFIIKWIIKLLKSLLGR